VRALLSRIEPRRPTAIASIGAPMVPGIHDDLF